jgi:hypothetical protein
MFRTLTICFCALALTACTSGRRGSDSGGDDDDDAPVGLGGLDLDGDGVLTDADLQPGWAGVYMSTSGGDDDGDEGESTEGASLTSGDGSWALRMTNMGGFALALTLWFDDPDLSTYELDEGTVELRSVGANAEGFLLWASNTEGEVTITEAGTDSASGFFEGTVELTVADDTETPTGEIITIEGFAFNDVGYVESR